MLPSCLGDMIAPDNEVRAIDAIVDRMGIQSMGFVYSKTKETGRKPYSPICLSYIAIATLTGYVPGAILRNNCSNSKKGRTIQDSSFSVSQVPGITFYASPNG